MAENLGGGLVGRRYEQFACLCDSLVNLLRWRDAVRSAEIDADRYLRAAKQRAKDIAQEISGDSEAGRLTEATSKIAIVSDISEIGRIAEFLLYIPLPVPLLVEETGPRLPFETAPTELEKPELTVAVISFALNNVAFGNPQTIEPNILHDLTVEIRLSRWPDSAKAFELDVVSVEPRDVYELPSFKFTRENETAPYILRQTGRMLLRVPQAILARPLEFAYRARFVPESSETQVVIEGQRSLRAQSFDPDVNPQTGYREVDRRIIEIRGRTRSNPGIGDEELAHFLQILASLGRIAGQSLQDNLFPGIWSESKFQEEIKKLLRADARIGSQLEEHPRAGGGMTDLSFHHMRIELKVEPEKSVTVSDTQKYFGQTTQYVAGSDRRLGVLCVLDCFPKKAAPGSVANDIDLSNVPPPGNPNGLPILVGVVVIRGNLLKPSDLSK